MSRSTLFIPSTNTVSGGGNLGYLIGGKANSLVLLRNTKVLVPKWVALTTEFFQPWIDGIQLPSAHCMSQKRSGKELAKLSVQLVAEVKKGRFSEAQQRVIQEARNYLGESQFGFAVRSSAPAEDLSTSSFAGVYESFIGVTSDRLETAIRECFASYFSVRALNYRSVHFENSSTDDHLGFALIIQHQLDSQSAGVATSIHPTNNDYDEIAISANYGQCDSVVRGIVDPDQYVASKQSLTLLNQTLGSKSHVVRLRDAGGSEIIESVETTGYCLKESDVTKLAQIIIGIERSFECPVEIEWSLQNEEFQVLQARPLTRWVPLPETMTTVPGEPRRLYLDRALAEGMTMNAPISELGLDLIKRFEIKTLRKCYWHIQSEFANSRCVVIS